LLVPDSPFRRWYAARIAPRVAPWAGKAMTALFVVTVGVWLAIWATAAPEDRDRLQREVRDFIKSMEWGKADGPRPGPQAPPAAGRRGAARDAGIGRPPRQGGPGAPGGGRRGLAPGRGAVARRLGDGARRRGGSEHRGRRRLPFRRRRGGAVPVRDGAGPR